MAYLALYRKFRPKSFEELIGQEHIVRTLVNQINAGRIGHAYLFCGARGTGKTSAAKIFARAINCLSPVNGSPCGKCEVCKALAEGNNLDVLEMDAASNNKVENVRELREKIQYPPVSGKYKVYIIDEVHMLTTEAFNALLKTLEEPPEHAVFILATTESHKIPSTILSRCMRFDFRLIPTDEIASLIKKIYDETGKEYEEEAVYAIARAGAGSVRDALSIADTCVSYRDGKLTYDDVLEVLGATDGKSITELVKNIFDGNSAETLKAVEKLSESGKSIGVLCKDVSARIREILVCKTCEDGRRILAVPEDVYEEYKKAAEGVDENRILRCAEIFAEADGYLRYSQSPKIVFETACLKAATPAADYDLNALLSRISALEKEVKNLAAGAGNPISEDKAKEPEAKEKAKAPIENADEASAINDAKAKAEDVPVSEGANAGRLWGSVVRKLRSDGNYLLWVACREMRATLSGRKLRVIAPDDSGYGEITKSENLSVLGETVAAFGDYDIEIVKEESGFDPSTNRDGFKEATDGLKRTFGDDIVEVKK